MKTRVTKVQRGRPPAVDGKQVAIGFSDDQRNRLDALLQHERERTGVVLTLADVVRASVDRYCHWYEIFHRVRLSNGGDGIGKV